MVEGTSAKNEIFKHKITIEKGKFLGNVKNLLQQHDLKGEKHGK